MTTNISVTIKRTFNLKDYENIAPMVTITEEVGENLSDEQISKRTTELKEMIMVEIKEFKTKYIPSSKKPVENQ